MNPETVTAPPVAQQRLVHLLQCSTSRCGHVLIESEYVWLPDAEFPGSKRACCPKCGNDSFYTLNAKGQIRKQSDESSRIINAADIEPSPRMGLKMRRRLLAAKRRAMEVNDVLNNRGCE